MLHKVLVSKRPRKEEIIIAEVHTTRKPKTPVRQQEEEGERGQDDFSEGEDALRQKAADCALY